MAEPELKPEVPGTGQEAPPMPEAPIEVPEPSVEAPEAVQESASESEPKEGGGSPAEAMPPEAAPPPLPVQAAAPPPPPPKDPIVEQIEGVMAEDLTDLFLKLPPAEQAKFKEEGERVALSVRELARSGASKAKEIFGLIAGWLKLLPGVNKFFLEQEAKIKTDRILLAVEELSKTDENTIA